MLVVIARIQQIPPDRRGGYDLATSELTMSTDDYDRALEQLRNDVPERWRPRHPRWVAHIR